MGFQHVLSASDLFYANGSEIVAAHHRFIAALAGSPLRGATFFRSQPVTERDHDAYMSSTEGSLRVGEDIAAAWRDAHPFTPVVDMRGFSRVANCSAPFPGGFCRTPRVTYDAVHPQGWATGLRLQATLNAVAAHACRRGPMPDCRVIC